MRIGINTKLSAAGKGIRVDSNREQSLKTLIREIISDLNMHRNLGTRTVIDFCHHIAITGDANIVDATATEERRIEIDIGIHWHRGRMSTDHNTSSESETDRIIGYKSKA